MSLAEQLTRAFNAVTEASTRNTQQTLASLNDHVSNLIQRVAALEKSATDSTAKEDLDT